MTRRTWQNMWLISSYLVCQTPRLLISLFSKVPQSEIWMGVHLVLATSVKHEDTRDLVVYHQTPEIYHGFRQWCLGHYKLIFVFESLGKFSGENRSNVSRQWLWAVTRSLISCYMLTLSLFISCKIEIGIKNTINENKRNNNVQNNDNVIYHVDYNLIQIWFHGSS